MIEFMLFGAGLGTLGGLYAIMSLIYSINKKRKLKDPKQLEAGQSSTRRCRGHPFLWFRKKRAEGIPDKPKKRQSLKEFLKAEKSGDVETAEVSKKDFSSILKNPAEKLYPAILSLVAADNIDEAERLGKYLKKKSDKQLEKEKKRRQDLKLAKRLIKKYKLPDCIKLSDKPED